MMRSIIKTKQQLTTGVVIVISWLLFSTVSVHALERERSHVRGSGSDSSARREQAESGATNLPDDAFSLIFLADLENRYRRHPVDRSRYVLDYVVHAKDHNLFFDGPYSATQLDPQLIIHGGDLSHMWGCGFTYGPVESGVNCRKLDNDYYLIWNVVIQSGRGLPLLSSYGNHDWWVADGTGNGDQWLKAEADPGPEYADGAATAAMKRPHSRRVDIINARSSDLVEKIYEMSKRHFGVDYQRFLPQGEIGQSMYRTVFKGIQIASFGSSSNWQSYDKSGTIYESDTQFTQFASSLDRNMTTIFYQHYPIGSVRTNQQRHISLVGEFSRTVHLTGHYHVANQQRFSSGVTYPFTEYIAPYPHSWFGLTPGFYALLVSPTQGILQVKLFSIPGLPDGTVCDYGDGRNCPDPTTCCGACDSGGEKWYKEDVYKCGGEPSFNDGDCCIPLASCYRCTGSYSYWKSKRCIACGSE